jgi:signal transduction histidine kinase
VNALATVLASCAAVFGYVTVHFGALAWLRPAHREYRVFAALALLFVVYAMGLALSVDAPDAMHAAGPQRIAFAALMLATALFADFVLQLADVSRPRVVAVAYAIGGVGSVLCAAGLFFDPAVTTPGYSWAAPSAFHAPTVELTAVGLACGVPALAVSAYAISALFASPNRDLRVAAAFTMVTVGAGAIDIARAALDLWPLNLTALVAVLPVLGFSFLLMARFTRADVQLADREQKLARSYDDMRHAQEELVKKEQLAAVGELSAVIAHEVRNPLAIIKNAVGGLRRRELSPGDGETLLEILDDETDRLNRLVDDLLAYARPIAPERGQVDICKLVGHAVELAAGGSRDISTIEIELDLGRGVAPIVGDEALLRHALINIVDNALQAMPDGGTLSISCRDTDLQGVPSVAVEFHDTGEGMDTLVRSKARDPFFTTRQTGTGLGLAIVDRVARAHRGTVEIESRHGQGTKVSFIVPREGIAPP